MAKLCMAHASRLGQNLFTGTPPPPNTMAGRVKLIYFKLDQREIIFYILSLIFTDGTNVEI